MKKLHKCVIALVALLSSAAFGFTALAADGDVTIVPDFTYYLHRVGFRQASGEYYYISNPSYVGGKGNASLLTDYSIPERTFSNPKSLFPHMSIVECDYHDICKVEDMGNQFRLSIII